MRVGAGIKNKILQAWAMGKAVVATPLSTGGLRCKDGENILVRDTPEGLAHAVCDLLENQTAREKIGRCGRQTILDYYTWEAKGRELEALMETLSTANRQEASMRDVLVVGLILG